jgi:hypothetical protein
MLNWTTHFRTAHCRTARAITRLARRAGLSPARARALGHRLAAQPLDRDDLIRLRDRVLARLEARRDLSAAERAALRALQPFDHVGADFRARLGPFTFDVLCPDCQRIKEDSHE